jgi:hypothetical protein
MKRKLKYKRERIWKSTDTKKVSSKNGWNTCN